MLIDTKWHSKLCYYLYYLLDQSNSLENCHFFSWGLEYTCIRNSAGWLVYKPIKSMNLLAIQEYLYFFFCCLGPVIGKKREKCSKIVINKVDLQFFYITNAVRMYLIFFKWYYEALLVTRVHKTVFSSYWLRVIYWQWTHQIHVWRYFLFSRFLWCIWGSPIKIWDKD